MDTEHTNNVHRVWRALDAETCNFGIRGRYLLLLLVLSAAAIFFTSIIWALAGSIIGMIIGAVALAAAYIAVQITQGLMTFREFERKLFCMRLSKYLRFDLYSLERYFQKNEIEWK